jgi:hypothetical protein
MSLGGVCILLIIWIFVTLDGVAHFLWPEQIQIYLSWDWDYSRSRTLSRLISKRKLTARDLRRSETVWLLISVLYSSHSC